MSSRDLFQAMAELGWSMFVQVLMVCILEVDSFGSRTLSGRCLGL